MPTTHCLNTRGSVARRLAVVALTSVALGSLAWWSATAQGQPQRTFPTPEDAVRALSAVVSAGNLDELIIIFGPDSRELVESSDPATGQRNRQIFTVAIAEGWHLADEGANRKTLIVGNEDWPFPVPLVKDGNVWRFDTAAGREEVLDRRIGRNELAVIQICHTYVTAQRRYAQEGHDGRPAGLFAQAFRSDPGTQNGLYWVTGRGEKRSPLGDLVAEAAAEGRPMGGSTSAPAPFHGYYFKIQTAQGPAAPGGARSYIGDGGMVGGFGLVAWPAYYDASGVMTFIVSNDGIVYQKDLGPDSDARARAMNAYNPDASWTAVRVTS